jgi:hypothetical protein
MFTILTIKLRSEEIGIKLMRKRQSKIPRCKQILILCEYVPASVRESGMLKCKSVAVLAPLSKRKR